MTRIVFYDNIGAGGGVALVSGLLVRISIAVRDDTNGSIVLT
ncbi:hypothetical protein [Algoriphagus sp. Y33]|nr:hypothetical protein [Algoriphagus sp. Y33]